MAEIKNMDAVAALDAMDAHVDDWRDATKGKQRGIFSFDDVAALKIKNLKKRIYTDIESIPAWKMKECIYKGVDDYEYLYDEWKELNVGDRWGNNGWSAFFKNSFKTTASGPTPRTHCLSLFHDSIATTLPVEKTTRSSPKETQTSIGALPALLILLALTVKDRL